MRGPNNRRIGMEGCEMWDRVINARGKVGNRLQRSFVPRREAGGKNQVAIAMAVEHDAGVPFRWS